ncbi:MAG: hypothetical protein ABII90_14090, partial [Bacteroidota bacterium]
MTIITEYPPWYIIFCFALGALYAFILYNKDKNLSELPLWLKRMMALFRFCVVGLIAFLLLNPLLKTIFRQVEKPIIIIAQDDSQSLLIGKDSSYYKNGYRESLNNFISDLSNKYDVKTYSFGDKITSGINHSFTGKQTDISALFEEIHTRYSNRNVGAVILASDGLYNKGSNPVYSVNKIKSPVYTVALGDTSIRKDIILSKVAHNRLAYLGNEFPIEIVVDAKQCEGHNTRVTVCRGKEELFFKNIDINTSSFNTVVPVRLTANEMGIQRYRVRLSAIDDEISKNNNTLDFFIDILDSRQKILILANSPHPDVSALRQSLEMNENYEVEVLLIASLQQTHPSKAVSIEKYNLIILHQIPSLSNTSTNLLSDILKSNTPVLYILGGQSGLNYFNNLKAGLNISESQNRLNEVQGYLAEDFTLFTLSDNIRAFVEKSPPLLAPFGNY